MMVPTTFIPPDFWEGLKKKKHTCHFFSHGQKHRGKAEDLVLQMSQDGHLIGNHTYNHVELDKISKAAAKKEILQTNESIWEITGIYPEFSSPALWSLAKKSGFLCNHVSCTLGY